MKKTQSLCIALVPVSYSTLFYPVVLFVWVFTFTPIFLPEESWCYLFLHSGIKTWFFLCIRLIPWTLQLKQALQRRHVVSVSIQSLPSPSSTSISSIPSIRDEDDVVSSQTPKQLYQFHGFGKPSANVLRQPLLALLGGDQATPPGQLKSSEV